ncbi:MAG: NAD(P)/FAD-dependent oxidoreductase [Candidatus Melainabacteria bacterium]|nr:NAD(P)/FAD-dependent oxidoreductase [Candidatus Melainabacteria bacterium]
MPLPQQPPHVSATGSLPHIVIVGGGFAGLYTAKGLGNQPVRVTLVDKRNFHLFQPLLYQVATGNLSPADISAPLRAVLNRYKNVETLLGEVVGIDPHAKTLTLRDGSLSYDQLVLAAGGQSHYFGNDHWAEAATSLKTLEDAIEMRHKLFLAFEAAERQTDAVLRKNWLRFVIIGGGPTGVELAGSLVELAHSILREDFRHIQMEDLDIVLLEGCDRLLAAYPEKLSRHAEEDLTRLGVRVCTGARVTHIQPTRVSIEQDGSASHIATHTVLWAAGVKASPLGQQLASALSTETDRGGRLIVNPDLTLPGHPDIYVAGDLAHVKQPNGQPLPGVAPVAMQQGIYIAKRIRAGLNQQVTPPFSYVDKGSLAVIGRNRAVAHIGPLQVSGLPAWLIWSFIHIWYLIGFENQLQVFIRWLWAYLTRHLDARLITVRDPFPLCQPPGGSSPQPTAADDAEEAVPHNRSVA